MNVQSETEVPVTFTLQIDLVGIGQLFRIPELLGGRIEGMSRSALGISRWSGLGAVVRAHVGGRSRCRVEAATDEETENTEQFEVVGLLAVDGGPGNRVHHSGAGVLADLVEAGEKIHSHGAMQFGDPVDVG